jgi:hypothetical protein
VGWKEYVEQKLLQIHGIIIPISDPDLCHYSDH